MNLSADEQNNNTETTPQQEVAELQVELTKTKEKMEEYYNNLLLKTAEFDNFRKRTNREKEALYKDASAATILAFIPVLDNLERAVDSCGQSGEVAAGVSLILKQFKEVMWDLGVEPIKSVGEQFDPNIHEAVSHINDDTIDDNTVVEEFQKGYIMAGKVMRFAKVKVAN